jgi:hypothetical protein
VGGGGDGEWGVWGMCDDGEACWVGHALGICAAVNRELRVVLDAVGSCIPWWKKTWNSWRQRRDLRWSGIGQLRNRGVVWAAACGFGATSRSCNLGSVMEAYNIKAGKRVYLFGRVNWHRLLCYRP